jgi:hypothetical protein
MPNMTCITSGRAASSDAARLRRKSAAIMAGAIASASIAVCARADAANPDARQIVRVGEICRTVIGLEPGGAQYEACALSLADSLRSLGRDRAVPRVQVDCLEKGLKPGLAGCTLQSSGAEPTSSRSYFYVSQREVFRREQLSCIRLGLAPADGAFADCAANLDGRLFAADNPAQ